MEEVGTMHIISDDSHVWLDTTLSYRFSILEMEYSTNMDLTGKTKDGATTTNMGCGKSTNMETSTDGSKLKKAGVVGSDAHEEEGEHPHEDKLDRTTDDDISVCSSLPNNATSILY